MSRYRDTESLAAAPQPAAPQPRGAAAGCRKLQPDCYATVCKPSPQPPAHSEDDPKTMQNSMVLNRSALTATHTATVFVSAAIPATAIGTQLYIDKENGWGRSHIPPHGRGGNLILNLPSGGDMGEGPKPGSPGVLSSNKPFGGVGRPEVLGGPLFWAGCDPTARGHECRGN